MNVGITLPTPSDDQAHTRDPLLQLVYLLVLLRNSPWVDSIHLLSTRDSFVVPACMGTAGLSDLPIVRPEAVTHTLDLVIQMGTQLPTPWLRHMNALGARLVLYLLDQPYASQIENPMFGHARDAVLGDVPWHEIWLLPQHAHTSLMAIRTLARVPVRQVPLLWSPVGLAHQIAHLNAPGRSFGFDPASRAAPPGSTAAGWRVGIFSTNRSVTSSAVMALLACEHACRSAPDAVARVLAISTLHVKDHPTFNRFGTGLTCTQQGKATFEPKLLFSQCAMTLSVDMVVSHDWEDGPVDAVFDALHGGYPVVHNHPALQRAGVGLFYPGFSARQGGDAIVQAWQRDAAFWKDYQRTATTWLERLSPTHPVNVAAFKALLSS